MTVAMLSESQPSVPQTLTPHARIPLKALLYGLVMGQGALLSVCKVRGHRSWFLTGVEEKAEFMKVREGIRPPLWSSGQSSWLHNGDVLCFL
jgi:hypothetical protein